MRRMMFCLFIVGAITFLSSPAANAQMQIYGAWHCGNDACTWASVRNMTDFDTKNHWMIDRGDGSGLPSVNLVVLSFLQPLKLLNKTTDTGDANGVPIGLNAAAVAQSLGVGIEIDYENSSSPNLTGLQAFIDAYRSQIPYDATGANPAARLTIDLAAGDRYLIGLCQKATASWLTTSAPVLDYANAMVPNKQPNTSGAESNW